jgi:hypothetical protein
LQYRKNSTNWTPLGDIAQSSYQLENVTIAKYEFVLRARSKTGTLSRPVYTELDLTVLNSSGEDLISGLELVEGGTTFEDTSPHFQWRSSPISDPTYTTGEIGRDELFRSYRINVYNEPTEEPIRTIESTEPRFDYTREMIQQDSPSRDFYLGVAVRDAYNYVSNEEVVQFYNPPPAAPGNLTVTPNQDAFTVEFDQPTDLDWTVAKVYASTIQGFTPDDGVNLVSSVSSNKIFVDIGIAGSTTYYVRVAVADTFSTDISDLNVSDEIEVTTLSGTVDHAWRDGTYSVDATGPGDVPRGGFGTITFTKDTNAAGSPAAGYIRVSDGVYYPPNDTKQTLSVATDVMTPFRPALNPNSTMFFLMWSDVHPSIRFGGGYTWGTSQIFACKYYWFTNKWEAIDYYDQRFEFSIDPKDVLVARGRWIKDDPDIRRLISFISYWENLETIEQQSGGTGGAGVGGGALSDPNFEKLATDGFGVAWDKSSSYDESTVISSLTAGSKTDWACVVNSYPGQTQILESVDKIFVSPAFTAFEVYDGEWVYARARIYLSAAVTFDVDIVFYDKDDAYVGFVSVFDSGNLPGDLEREKFIVVEGRARPSWSTHTNAEYAKLRFRVFSGTSESIIVDYAQLWSAPHILTDYQNLTNRPADPNNLITDPDFGMTYRNTKGEYAQTDGISWAGGSRAGPWWIDDTDKGITLKDLTGSSPGHPMWDSDEIFDYCLDFDASQGYTFAQQRTGLPQGTGEEEGAWEVSRHPASEGDRVTVSMTVAHDGNFVDANAGIKLRFAAGWEFLELYVKFADIPVDTPVRVSKVLTCGADTSEIYSIQIQPYLYGVVGVCHVSKVVVEITDRAWYTVDGVGDRTQIISSGVINPSGRRTVVDTEGAAGTDDLDTITARGDGEILILQAANSARTVVCKDGTGNLKLAGDFSLNNVEDTLTLICDGTNWCEMNRSDNGA